MTTNQPNTIASQNDAFRASPADGLVLTRGVSDNSPDFIHQALQAVAAFDTFTAANDPHGEHDFGAITVAGESLFWKIDYYDRSLEYGSPDPADAAVTRRILTIMLAEEY